MLILKKALCQDLEESFLEFQWFEGGIYHESGVYQLKTEHLYICDLNSLRCNIEPLMSNCRTSCVRLPIEVLYMP